MEGEQCFRDICIDDNYTLQFDPANLESDSYRNVRADFFLNDVKEVNMDHHHVIFDLGLMLTWRDTRISCRNQVPIIICDVQCISSNNLFIFLGDKMFGTFDLAR